MDLLYRGDSHDRNVHDFPLDPLAGEGTLGLFEAAASLRREPEEVETIPRGEKRFEPQDSPFEKALRSFVVSRGDVVEPDRNVNERLQEVAVVSLGLRPRFLEKVVALEVELSVEEIGGSSEELAVDHPRMVSRRTSLRK